MVFFKWGKGGGGAEVTVIWQRSEMIVNVSMTIQGRKLAWHHQTNLGMSNSLKLLGSLLISSRSRIKCFWMQSDRLEITVNSSLALR